MISVTRRQTMPAPIIVRRSPGTWYVLATPVVAGVVHLFAVPIGGLSATGLVWLVMLALGILIFLAEFASRPERHVGFPWLLWLPWVSWVWLSLAWTEMLGRENVQDACLMTMPVLVGVVASLCMHSEDQLQTLLRAFSLALVGLIVSLLWQWWQVGGDTANMEFRMGALTAVLIAAVFAAQIPDRPLSAWIGWLLCFALTLWLGARAAVFAIVLMPAVHPHLGRLATRLSLAAIVVLLSIGLLQTDQMQQRFFHGERVEDLSEVTLEQINTSGRLETWPILWREACRRPWFGAGAGTSGAFTDRVSNLGGHPHNDYLRVFFELGLFGSVIFLGTVLGQTFWLLVKLRESQGMRRTVLCAAMIGWLMFLLTSLTDNTLVYAAAYMNPLFALIGASTFGRPTPPSTTRHGLGDA